MNEKKEGAIYKEQTPAQKANEIVKKHFHSEKAIGQINYQQSLDPFYRMAVVTVNSIIDETLSEYTNDENHTRVEFYREVEKELNRFLNI